IYLRVFERANINNALYIAFNAPEEKKLSFFSDKGVVVPSGIEPVEFENTPPYGHWRNQHPSLVNKIIFLYLGRLNPNQKGLDMLLPAFAKLTTVRDDVHLILAGPDERGGEAEVRQMISSLRIESHVALTGMVDGTEKLSILNDSDAYALVSPSEGTSIALLEAMYMGLPVIASNRVGLSSQILDKNTGIVVERDINQIFTALDTIANDAVQRQQMGQNAHALVANKYTWNMIAIDLVETLRERADL
ncbi:MAG: glycosyltransferase, partial [Deltaproteobacteria bacterium]|nr:glycosyltransferase [Deltaproteobacteria bacterium]